MECQTAEMEVRFQYYYGLNDNQSSFEASFDDFKSDCILLKRIGTGFPYCGKWNSGTTLKTTDEFDIWYFGKFKNISDDTWLFDAFY